MEVELHSFLTSGLEGGKEVMTIFKRQRVILVGVVDPEDEGTTILQNEEESLTSQKLESSATPL